MRLLIAYLVAAGLGLLMTHRLLLRLRVPVALFLALLPVLFLGEAFARNGVYAPLDIAYRWEPLASYRDRYGMSRQRTPLLGDVVDQHIPWRKAVREAAKNGRLPLWNRFQLAGEPLLAMQMPQVLYPGTWLGFALPLAEAWTFDMALRIFLALVGAYVLLRDMDCGDIAACFGATAWALSDFLVFALGYPHGPAAAALPLLVAGLRRIVLSNGDHGRGLTTGATALIISSGHPETALHAVSAAGLFFLVVVAQRPPGLRARPIFQALLSGVVGVGLMAVVLAPFLEVLPHTTEYSLRSGYFAHTRQSVPLSRSLVNLENQIVPYSQGVSGKSFLDEHMEESSYAGSLVLLFAAVGLAGSDKRRLPVTLVGLLAILVAVGFPGVADAAGSLPLFDIAINQRLVFVGAFSLAILAGLGMEEILNGRKLRIAVLGAIGISAVVLLVWIDRRSTMLGLKMSGRYMVARLALELVPLVGALAVLLSRHSWRLPAWCAWTLPLLLAGLRYPEIGRLYPVAPAKAFYPPLEVLAPIPRNEPYRFTSLFLTFVPNIAALYELEDVRAYEAMTLRRLVETYPLWCVPQAVSFNRIDDPTRPFLSFLNVRYLLVPIDYATPPGWCFVKEGPGARLLENEHVLPRAFVPRRIYCDGSGAGDLTILQSIADFHDQGVASLKGPPQGWRDNGAASAVVRSYEPSAMTVAVDAQAPAVLATSIPAWPGWQIQIDDRAGESIFYNHAFLGIQVPPGHHVVALRYRPVGVIVGSLVTALALAWIVVAAASRRIRNSKRVGATL